MSTIYVPDIECDSCVRRISKGLVRNGVTTFSCNDETVTVEAHDEKKAIAIIKKLGYRASTEIFERKTWSERVRHFKENKHLYEIERSGIIHLISLFFILLAISGLAYISLWRYTEGFLGTYGWWILYLVITIATVAAGLWHFFAYRTKITCMVGMMIGMTFGMQTGMMIGAIIGATNGFFIGSMAGMLIGTAVGIWTGKCCGVMGVMEGAMAGVMGGTMGPMISVMMFSDHLLTFMPFYMAINIFIMLGMSYMLYEDVIEGKRIMKKPLEGNTLIALAVIATIILGALMIYGPKSALLSF